MVFAIFSRPTGAISLGRLRNFSLSPSHSPFHGFLHETRITDAFFTDLFFLARGRIPGQKNLSKLKNTEKKNVSWRGPGIASWATWVFYVIFKRNNVIKNEVTTEQQSKILRSEKNSSAYTPPSR